MKYGLDGCVAAATLIGSIAQTNTCRITRLARLVHVHTSGGSTVDKEEAEASKVEDEKEEEEEEESK